MGLVHDREFCDMLHSMYTDSPLLQEAEERQDKMMDCNYLKVDIDAMVADLDVNDSNKQQLKKTLRKFEHGLFGGGLGKLKNCNLLISSSSPVSHRIREDIITFRRLMHTLVRKRFNVWLTLES